MPVSIQVPSNPIKLLTDWTAFTDAGANQDIAFNPIGYNEIIIDMWLIAKHASADTLETNGTVKFFAGAVEKLVRAGHSFWDNATPLFTTSGYSTNHSIEKYLSSLSNTATHGSYMNLRLRTGHKSSSCLYQYMMTGFGAAGVEIADFAGGYVLDDLANLTKVTMFAGAAGGWSSNSKYKVRAQKV